MRITRRSVGQRSGISASTFSEVPGSTAASTVVIGGNAAISRGIISHFSAPVRPSDGLLMDYK